MNPVVTLCNLTSNPWQTVVNIYLSVMFYVVSQTKFSSSSRIFLSFLIVFFLPIEFEVGSPCLGTGSYNHQLGTR